LPLIPFLYWSILLTNEGKSGRDEQISFCLVGNIAEDVI